ncbi:LysR family transcriptional regulator [Stackebrandtia soli]|uniref:LysR family transcriptional regulator n=1 Tax=Stackebrandtia soli TaxID=1892856 RepID=UPI0039E756BF
MDTGWLEVFRDVAHSGSFTATSNRMGCTQSAVSRQIAALEAELGAVLFDRLPRGVRLTDAGRHLLGHAESVLDRLRDAAKGIENLRSIKSGRIRIGSFPTAGVALVPRAIATFRRRYPDVELEHRSGLTAELVERLRLGDLDVAVVSGYADQVAGLTAVNLVHVLDETMLVGLPRGHRLSDRDAVTLRDLAKEDWVAGNPDPVDTLFRSAHGRGFRPRIAYVVREWTAKQGFVAEGLGITLIPSLAIASVRSDVRLVPLRDHASVRGVYAATAAERAVSAPVAAFLTELGASAALLTTKVDAVGADADNP